VGAAAQGCCCEAVRVSWYSPQAISDSEELTRFVFLPMHVDRRGNVKPNFFDYVHSHGCSVQRTAMATLDELVYFVESFLARKSDSVWLGAVSASCREIRAIRYDDDSRAVCVYDTGERRNPAHGELFATRYDIEEADGPELRARLRAAFNVGTIVGRQHYHDGTVWAGLTPAAQARTQKKR